MNSKKKPHSHAHTHRGGTHYPAKAAPQSKNALIAAGLVTLSIGVIVAVWLLFGNPFEQGRSIEQPSYFTLQKDLRVNIDGGRNSAVVIGMTMEMKNDKALDKAKENEAIMVEGMRRYFQDKKPEQLRGGENMKQVAEDLTGVVNDQIREKGMKTPVKSIWFNKYLIQD